MSTPLLQRAGNRLAPVLHALRPAQSGVVTDEVAWLVAGAAALGFAVLVSIRP